MEKQTLGILEIQDVIIFVEDLAKVIKEAKADGKLDIFDAVKLITVVPSMVAAAKGSDQIKAEIGDLNGEELEAVLDGIKDALFALISALL